MQSINQHKNCLFPIVTAFLFVFLVMSHSFLACSIIEEEDPTPTPTMTPTPTPTPTPTFTPSPRSEPMITSVWPAHYTVNRLSTGDAYYVDSTAEILGMPQFLQDTQAISTSLSDENITEFPYVQFLVDRPVMVYVGYDNSVDSIPNWLQVFSHDDGQVVTLGNPVNRQFQLYHLLIPAGLVHLGGNNAWGTIGDPKTFLIFIKGYEGDFVYREPRRITYYDYNGEFRSWFLQFPMGYEPNGQAPLLYYLQGAQTSTDYIGITVESTGLMEACDERGFLLVAPELNRYIWGPDQETIQVDFEFLYDLKEFSRYFFPHHPEKIFCTGFSSGAFFANIAGLIPPRFYKAIAPFAGGIPDNSPYWPDPTDEAFPVLLMVGENDSLRDAVEWAYYLYATAGYPAELHYIYGWGHSWYEPYNDLILDFFMTVH